MEKIQIDIFRKKSIEEFSEILSSSESRMESGSASAGVAAISAALLKRAAHQVEETPDNAERVQYIQRNSEIIRNYMCYLVDEDVKCRNPIKKAISENNPQHIEACVQPACAINSEIINMMISLLSLSKELCEYSNDKIHYIYESADYSMAAIRACVSFIYSMLKYCTDDTFIYVTKRENEVSVAQAEEIYHSIVSHFTLPV